MPGKSSLTASFILDGSEFISDDISPVIFRDSKPYMWPLNRPIKLREHSIEQLKINRKSLRVAESGAGKKYLQVKVSGVEDHVLNTILKDRNGGSGET
ncbi:MAG: hypothetical protein MZU84_05035 [Sphingobacterium sp.]|nr:hypothetical protein [Sphingobacterium sp.]